MLMGEYEHTLDPKGRVIFPAKLREDLGDNFIIAKGLDNCLFVYPPAQWQRLQDSINALPFSKASALQRFFFSGASEAISDKQGRVLIPANLRQYAGLDKDIIIVGASVRAEIWDKTKWQEQSARLTAETIENVMDELGF
ncbi:division/cell wall cluster transcriptional repressor MraZ [Acetanaerobacterium elongatum]|uniref:Transcriptional regulator MraZ n=1 Tax=Acetanaerobacterium elongatum TaxID=258515 RepID=A0A1G9VJ96_9FIRM|nr:division/cell wall cluster transcriptional repressor MraZ [Acetanaerobacterium elongatum]SDM72153.1 MraZ protein [Acetanaerobacterium elongatum]